MIQHVDREMKDCTIYWLKQDKCHLDVILEFHKWFYPLQNIIELIHQLMNILFGVEK